MYKTEKRFASVGEKILITEAGMTEGIYKDGDVLTVSQTAGAHPEEPNPEDPFVLNESIGDVFCAETGVAIYIASDEYEVIIEEEIEQ